MPASDETSVASRSVSSMRKWGIPANQTPELTLLERLVWVNYKTHWWPALLYESYSELQTHLYDQLDMELKAQFAMAIMRQLQAKKKIKVARLLGRRRLEIIEVAQASYYEFYWQLPNVLPKACRRENYQDVGLYFDFHRALDQVEEIIREVSNQTFALGAKSEQRTWYDRALSSLAKEEDDSSAVSSVVLNKTSRKSKTSNKSNLPVPIKRTSSLESSSDSTIATHEVSVWSSQKNGIRSGVEVRLREPANGSLNDYRNEDSSRLMGSDFRSDLSMQSSVISERSHISQRSRGQQFSIGPLPSVLSVSSSSSSRRGSSTCKSRRSHKSKISQANTEVVDNTTESRNMNNSKEFQNIDTREPEVENALEPSLPPRPEPKPGDLSVRNRQVSSRVRTLTPIQVLPGLEGDDIVPGLSARVHDARRSWNGVLGVLTGARGVPQLTNAEVHENKARVSGMDTLDIHPVQHSLSQIEEETVRRPSTKELVEVLASEGTPQEEARRLLRKPQASVGFWQRFTCYATD